MFKQRVTELDSLNDQEKKRVQARDTVASYSQDLLKLRVQSVEIQSQIENLCVDESSDDVANTCAKLRKDLDTVQSDIKKAKDKVGNALDKYMKF